MIIFELLMRALKMAGYGIARPMIWVVTARDCKHCIHGLRGWGHRWRCGLNYIPDQEACIHTPWRCKFERRKRRFY